jgi:predicted nucleic acid-binding protein
VRYLLDTNVVSELVRPKPDARVLAWFRGVDEASLHLSVLTLGELRSGVGQLREPARRERLRVWLERDLPERLEDRLLPVTAAVADRWGRLIAEAGRPLAAVDSLLAATALHHGLRMVTRNVKHFGFDGLEVVSPWEAAA